MHTFTVLFICISLLYTQNTESRTSEAPQPKQSSHLDPVDAAAMQAFGNTVQCIFNIVDNPDDPKNIATNASTIFSTVAQFIAFATSKPKKNNNSTVDATHEINELCLEQLMLTHNIHTMLDSIGKVIESLGSLMNEQCDPQSIGKTINHLLEKIVTIAVAIMKSHYLQGHATEDDFELYLRNLEDLQEQIKHSIMTNALYLRERKQLSFVNER